MPTTPVATFGVANHLIPIIEADEAPRMAVNLATGTYPAGTVLGEVTATPGTYAAYVDTGGVNAVQLATIEGTSSGGSFILGFNDQFTTALAYNASGAAVQAALRVLSGDTLIAVSLSAGVYTITFSGARGAMPQPLLAANGSLLTGSADSNIVVTNSVAGVTGPTDGTQNPALLLEYASISDGTNITIGAPSATVVQTVQGNVSPAINQIETITLNGVPTGGTFTVSMPVTTAGAAGTTTAIAYNATAATLQTALRLVASIGTGDCTVTGGAGAPYVVTFISTLAALPLPLMTVNTNLLTAAASGGEWAQTTRSVPAYMSGTFRTEDLVGFDANALAKMGRLLQGSVTSGRVVIFGS
jgi:hypothetical protein